jgi:hypothetical protein
MTALGAHYAMITIGVYFENFVIMLDGINVYTVVIFLVCAISSHAGNTLYSL